VAAGARLFDLDGTLWDSFAFYSAIVSRGGAITAEAASAEALNWLKARNIRVLSIAPLIGEAVRRIADESSVSSLFD